MDTLRKYVFSSFLTAFLLSFLVLTFVLTIGLLVQIVGLMLRGLPISQVIRFICIGFPETMQWTVPLSLLASSVLVFSRLSADSEIAAMRAGGVNIVRVAMPPVLFAVFCTALCAWVNFEIVPRAHTMRRQLKSSVNVETAVNLLEPGRMITDFPGVKLYFEKKDDESSRILYGASAYETTDPKCPRYISASKVQVFQDGADVQLDMYGVTISPIDEKTPGTARIGRFSQTFTNVLKTTKYFLREKDFRFRDIIERIGKADADVAKTEAEGPAAFKKIIGKEIVDGSGAAAAPDAPDAEEAWRKTLKAQKKWASELKVEFMKRIVAATASLCFVLIGIPLGIKSQRKESSAGMGLALLVALGFYLSLILATSMGKYPAAHAHWLIWIPPAAGMYLAFRLIRRHL